MITQQPKLIKSPKIIDPKSVTIKHLKTSHKLPKTIKQSEIVRSGKNQTTPLYSETTKREKIFDEKTAKNNETI